MDGVAANGAVNRRTRFVRGTAGHQRYEITPWIVAGVVELGISANRRTIRRVTDQVNWILARGRILDLEAGAAHGCDCSAIAGGGLGSAGERTHVIQLII